MACRVLVDAVSRIMPNQSFGQTEPVQQPAQRYDFELGNGGRRFPENAVGVQRRGEQFGKDGGRRRCIGEKRQKARDDSSA